MNAITFTASGPESVPHPFTCKRCKRQYPALVEGRPRRCECGWRYTMLSTGLIDEQFTTRIGAGLPLRNRSARG